MTTPSSYEVVFYEDTHRQTALQKDIVVTEPKRIYIRNISGRGTNDTKHLTEGLTKAFGPYGTVARIQLIEYTENDSTYDLAEAYVYAESAAMPKTKGLLRIDGWDGAEILCFWNPYPPCPYCRGADHLKVSCPKLGDIVCYACDKPGRFAASCEVFKEQQQRIRAE
ncbi:hypothetical protein DFQ27_001358 [Actinomortierella ambigua]|uniref:Uncharacterized protein n=1 Tax=Actinomortierella ambigua TaxID=1343610 RepID=A0A9P6PII2_9FUNG|nr:hypothetical protein DFQ27_001358 [Actinomortierella ambigua]